MCCVSFGAANLLSGSFLVLAWLREAEKYGMFSTSVLVLIVAAATSLVSGGPVYEMSPSGSGCGVSTEIKYHVLANQISPKLLLHAFLLNIAKLFFASKDEG